MEPEHSCRVLFPQQTELKRIARDVLCTPEAKKRVRTAEKRGVITFATFNGTALPFSVNIEEHAFAPILPWVREQTQIPKLQVVRGDEIIDDMLKFMHLSDGEVLNVIFLERRLPFLDVEVCSNHGRESEVIDLARLRMAGDDTTELSARFRRHRLMGFGSYDRWELTHHGHRILCSDKDMQPMDLQIWLDMFSLEGSRIQVRLQMILPIVHIVVDNDAERWVKDIDLEAETITTPRQLLQRARAILNISPSSLVTLHRKRFEGYEVAPAPIAESDADLDACILLRNLRNHEVLTLTSHCLHKRFQEPQFYRQGGEVKRIRC